MFFFRKTRLALEVIREIDIQISSETQSCLLSLLLYSAKQNHLLLKEVGSRLSERESMLMAAISVASNSTAVEELCRVTRLDFSDSIRVMMSLDRAARKVAVEYAINI